MEHSVEEQVEGAFLDALETNLGFRLPSLLDEYELEINELLMQTLAECLADLNLSTEQYTKITKLVDRYLVPKSSIYHHEWRELCHES